MRRLAPMLLAALALVLGACEKKKTEPSPSGGGTTPAAQGGAPGAPADANSILLGEVLSITGGTATFGISTRNGIELALNEANAAGGVKGKKLVARVYDNQGRPEEAAQDLGSHDRGDVAPSHPTAQRRRH